MRMVSVQRSSPPPFWNIRWTLTGTDPIKYQAGVLNMFGLSILQQLSRRFLIADQKIVNQNVTTCLIT